MKIFQFILCAMLSAATAQSFALEGRSIASDPEATLRADSRNNFVTVSSAQSNAMENRILSLETKLASLENSNLANAATGNGPANSTGSPCTSCGCTNCNCGADCCENCCCKSDCCGWMNTDCGAFGEAQLMFLRVHDSEAEDGGRRFETGSRYTIGYMGNCGSSIRARYFEYSSPFAQGAGNVQLEYFDTEYATRFCLGNVLRGELSVGGRWAQYDEFHDFGEGSLRSKYNDTIGIVVGLGLRGPSVYCWDTFLNLRYSQQFGQRNFNIGPETSEAGGTFSITEMQLGLTREFCCEGDGIAWVSIFVESQIWSGVQDDDSEDLGLAGLGFAVGFRR